MRNRKAPERYVIPDPKFQSETVSKFVNRLMIQGKKSLSYAIFYGALEIVEKKTGKSGLDVFQAALNNVMPDVEVRSRRVGGATFQIPTEVRPKRKMSMGMKWLILYARRRGEKTMCERLAAEMVQAAEKQGAAVKKRDETHKMADANKAFSHFRI